MTRCLILFIFICLTSNPSTAQMAKENIKMTDMLRIKSISGLTLNYDGSKAAFTLTSIEPDGEAKVDFKYVNHIYVAATDGSSPPKELTVKESSSQPAWSPDGKQLAFVRLVDSKTQIFLLPIDGGEPVQFTHFRYGAGNPKWSPDGKKILFSSNIELKDLLKDSALNPEYSLPKWPYEQPGFATNSSLILPVAKANPDGNLDEIRAYLDNDLTDKKAKILDKLDFQDESQVSGNMSFNHFFLQAIRPGAQPIELTHGFYGFSRAVFTPDSRQLIITGDIDSTEHPDRSQESEIYLCDSNGNNLHMLLGKKNISYTGMSVSPSGEWLAYQSQPTDSASLSTIGFISLSTGTPRIREDSMITIPFDRDPGNAIWSRDEKMLYFTAASNGGFPLYRYVLETKKTEPLTDSSSGIGSFDIGTSRIVYVKTTVSDPFELFHSDLELEHPQSISSFNSEWLQRRKISYPEKYSFINNQGMTVEYWVMKPVNYVQGKKYPLLLEIHGGPAAMWGPGESSMWHEFQVFCSKGYGVVYCNPRGSGGYGSNFLRANVKDWGTGPSSDVLTALNNCISLGWADTSKLVISGGSYGGYLVAWIVAHDHRFKAACAQRGVYDLATFFGEGNAWRLVPHYFGGYPWEPAARATLQRESPIQYVDQITTPLILFHGENDRRTGFVQGEMMFRSLKVLERPVEYVRHPGATHEITRSGDNRQRIDQLLRTYEFFERWLGKPRFMTK